MGTRTQRTRTIKTTITKGNKVVLSAPIINSVDTDMYVYCSDTDGTYEWQIFNLEKCETIKGKYSNVWQFYNDVACVRLPDGKYNYIDRDGDFLFPMHLDTCKHIFEEAVMGATIKKQEVRISITGCIDMSKAALCALMLKGD